MYSCCLSMLYQYIALCIYSINFLENFSSILISNIKNSNLLYWYSHIDTYVRLKLKQLYNYKSSRVVKLKHP